MHNKMALLKTKNSKKLLNIVKIAQTKRILSQNQFFHEHRRYSYIV